jgi:hypothetical protein
MSRSQLARDVATELESRRRRRKAFTWTAFIAAVAAAIFYLRCGTGFGIGGKDEGKGEGTGVASSAQTPGPKRCVVRVAAKGITVDGKAMKRSEAVDACKKTDGALVTVTGDARQGDWDELRTALEKADVKIYTRGDR